MGHGQAAWTHDRTDAAVYTVLAGGLFLQTFSTSFGRKKKRKKKVMLKTMFHRNVLNSAIFSEEEGETLWRRYYT